MLFAPPFLAHRLMADERVAQLMVSGRLLLLHWSHFNDLEGLPERGFQDVSRMEGRGWKGAI